MAGAGKVGLTISIRSATEADLGDIAEMVSQQAAAWDHPAKSHPRPMPTLREAYFGPSPVAHLLVATRGDRVVGMAQWTRMYDMFWAQFHGEVEWLYVRPDSRGLGASPALIAAICKQVRDAGGDFLRGAAGSDENTQLYESVAVGWPSRHINLHGEAFHAFADVAGLAPREIVRRLPRR